jgi:hypothetical protein
MFTSTEPKPMIKAISKKSLPAAFGTQLQVYTKSTNVMFYVRTGMIGCNILLELHKGIGENLSE